MEGSENGLPILKRMSPVGKNAPRAQLPKFSVPVTATGRIGAPDASAILTIPV
ncbi:MAG: hypothetical protein CM1200mP8_4890 [Chloroflexota bacterium]|nr:MAG: hypothetical protein CM1200mP8_4890 [Chloroflexota bacterium]